MCVWQWGKWVVVGWVGQGRVWGAGKVGVGCGRGVWWGRGAGLSQMCFSLSFTEGHPQSRPRTL